MKALYLMLISTLLATGCASYGDYMNYDNESLLEGLNEYTIGGDSVSITKERKYVFEVYKDHHMNRTHFDTLFNIYAKVYRKEEITKFYYFSKDDMIDSCVILFPNEECLDEYISEYLWVTCSYDWIRLDKDTYFQTNWSRKLKQKDPETGDKQKLIGSRVLKIFRTNNPDGPQKITVTIPLIDQEIWNTKTQKNKD